MATITSVVTTCDRCDKEQPKDAMIQCFRLSNGTETRVLDLCGDCSDILNGLMVRGNLIVTKGRPKKDPNAPVRRPGRPRKVAAVEPGYPVLGVDPEPVVPVATVRTLGDLFPDESGITYNDPTPVSEPNDGTSAPFSDPDNFNPTGATTPPVGTGV